MIVVATVRSCDFDDERAGTQIEVCLDRRGWSCSSRYCQEIRCHHVWSAVEFLARKVANRRRIINICCHDIVFSFPESALDAVVVVMQTVPTPLVDHPQEVYVAWRNVIRHLTENEEK